MNTLFASIGHNLRRLADFSGRETQILFWPYAILVYALSTVAAMVIVMVPIMRMFSRMMEQISAAEAQGGTVEPDFVKSPEMLMPDFSGLQIPMALVNAITILLLAAAVARRLHDKDRTALWALLPLPSVVATVALMPVMMPSMAMPSTPGPLMFFGSLNSMAYFGLFILLIVLTVGEGTRGPNRFGPEVGAA